MFESLCTNSTLLTLNLANNEIDDLHLDIDPDESNTTLTELDLSANLLCQKSAGGIVLLLQKLSSLKVLHLHGNSRLGDQGAENIVTALVSNKTLKKISFNPLRDLKSLKERIPRIEIKADQFSGFDMFDESEEIIFLSDNDSEEALQSPSLLTFLADRFELLDETKSWVSGDELKRTLSKWLQSPRSQKLTLTSREVLTAIREWNEAHPTKISYKMDFKCLFRKKYKHKQKVRGYCDIRLKNDEQ